MYLLFVFLTLISSCLTGFFGKFLGWGACVIPTICVFLSFLLSLFIFFEVALIGCFTYVKLWIWFNLDTLHINWGFTFDSLTVCMFIVVTFISFLVHLYSIEYMNADPHLPRFMSYLSLFTFFMLILISADNFVQMFLGWEGVGLCSYLLINFWFTRIQANKAAIKAMLVNWIGDFGLVVAILFIYKYYKALDYATVFLLTPLMIETTVNFLNSECFLLTIIGCFLLIAAVGKSAQIGLHTWLPDAMEGPTPVSALIHAATMVTAGIFLIVKCSFIYEYVVIVLKIVVIVGSLTAFFAASVGLTQNDIKRVIAYSTCSQLGYMLFSCGLSNYAIAFFHLANHAFFKALLFLSAGSIIHSINDNQDLRKMGGLKKLVPFTYVAIVAGSLALTGFPFLTGFYSKDLILEISFSNYTLFGRFCYMLGLISAFFTAFYSTRLTCLGFLSKPTGYKQIICFVHDAGLFICIVLGLLVLPSVLIGYFSKDLFTGIGTGFFKWSIYENLLNFNLFDAEFMVTGFKILPLIVSFFGLVFAFICFIFKSKILFLSKYSVIGKKIYYFLNWKWFFDKIYIEYFAQHVFKFSFSVSYKIIDRGVIEIFGPTGLCFTVLKLSWNIHKMQTSKIYHYTLVLLIGITLFFCLWQLWFVYKFYVDYWLFVIIFNLNFFVITVLK